MVDVCVSHKQCTRCGKSKDLEEFHKNIRGIFGRESHCKSCVCASKRVKRKKIKSLRKDSLAFRSYITGELDFETQQQFGSALGCCVQDLIENGKTT